MNCKIIMHQRHCGVLCTVGPVCAGKDIAKSSFQETQAGSCRSDYRLHHHTPGPPRPTEAIAQNKARGMINIRCKSHSAPPRTRLPLLLDLEDFAVYLGQPLRLRKHLRPSSLLRSPLLCLPALPQISILPSLLPRRLCGHCCQTTNRSALATSPRVW